MGHKMWLINSTFNSSDIILAAVLIFLGQLVFQLQNTEMK